MRPELLSVVWKGHSRRLLEAYGIPNWKDLVRIFESNNSELNWNALLLFINEKMWQKRMVQHAAHQWKREE